MQEIILEMVKEGKTTREITDRLNKEGVTSRTDKQPMKRKDVNNKITLMRGKGIKVPYKYKPKEKVMSSTNIVQESVEVLKVTQSEFAKKMGVTTGTVAGWKNRNNIPDKYKKKLTKILSGDTASVKVKKPRHKVQSTVTIQELPQPESDSFVIVFGKSSKMLKEILSNFNM